MDRPTLKLTFHEEADRSTAKWRRGDLVFGRDVQILEEILERFCFRSLSAKEYDLLLLAGAVAYIDRRCRRRRSGGWSRDLHLSLPVHTPRFWRATEVYRALCESLVYLTGDNWSFEFRPRNSPVGFLRKQQTLQLSVSSPIVLPSSHGLDSFANSLLLRKDYPNTDIVRVVTKNRSLGASPNLRPIIELQLPVEVRVKSGEASYRTRTFLFYVVAGVASATANATVTSIPENGQGSLGPSLVVDGNEWPYRGAHPGFTKRLEYLLSLITGARVRYDHPRLWNTKGEVLQALVRNRLENGWDTTRSCPRDQRHLRYSGPRIQCGICGACLLRRMAIRAAGLDGVEHYYWDDLAQDQMDKSVVSGARRSTNENDVDIFLSNALAMKRLAELSNVDETNPRLRQLAFEISEATEQDIGRTMHNLHQLLVDHAEEWTNFVNGLPRKSWFRQMCFV